MIVRSTLSRVWGGLGHEPEAKQEDVMRFVSGILIGGALLASILPAPAQEIDWQKVDETLGRKARCPATYIVTAFRAPTFR